MIEEFVKAWDANKGVLETYFHTHEQKQYSSYRNIVRQLFRCVINTYLLQEGKDCYDVAVTAGKDDPVREIDDGEYNGTLLFILHKDVYNPAVKDYVITSVEYGSCSGCDTLQGIHKYSEDFPDKEQVKDYMKLALHLLQRCHFLVESL